MIYFVTLMVSISVTTAFMLMFLVVLACKEKYSFSWIYGLIKTGLILLTVPVFVMAFLFVFGVLMSEFHAVDDMTNITAIYNGRYVVLRRFYSFRPYMWILLGIWLTGIFVSLGKTGKDIVTFKKNVMIHNKRITDETVLMKIDKIKRDLSVKETISVYYNEKVTVPMLVKWKKTMIVMGDNDLTEEEFIFILTHEFIHLKRKHIVFKALSVAVRTLYWFNPFTYYFVDFFSDYCEMDCDREVLKDAEVKQRISYAEIYLKFLPSAVYKNPVIQSSFIDSKRKQAVERRIRNIMNPGVKRNFKKSLVISIVYVLLFPGVIYGATIGGLELQRYFIRSYDDPYIEEVEPVQYVEEERQDIVRENVNYILLNVRLNKNVDEYIEPGGSIAIRILPACSEVRVSLMTLSEIGEFRVEVGDRWVMSVDTMLAYMFPGEEDMVDVIYIDNLTDEGMKITGVIGP